MISARIATSGSRAPQLEKVVRKYNLPAVLSNMARKKKIDFGNGTLQTFCFRRAGNDPVGYVMAA